MFGLPEFVVWACALAGVACGAWLVLVLRPAARARRRAQRAWRTIRRASARLQARETRCRETLRAAAERYADAACEDRLGAVPVEDLKAFGAENVRWSALREGGYVTARDLGRVPAKTLEAVKGIGAVGARRVVDAREALRAANRAEPVPPPPVDVDDCLELLRAAYAVLRNRDVLGTLPLELEGLEADARERRDDVRRNASIWRGLFASGERRRALRTAAIETADELVRDVELHAREGGPLARAREHLHRLDAELADPLPADAQRRDHAARFSDYCAVIEQALPERYGGRAGASGGLPEEIVARVEAQPLEVAGLARTLRPYQEFGTRYLLAQGRALLGDEMGLGKTIQALAAIVHVHATGEGTHFLVVSPASVLYSWAREVEHSTELTAFVLHGDERAEQLDAWTAAGGVALTSFGTLRRLAGEREVPALDVLVVDEAHYVKNPQAERTRATLELAGEAKRVVFLTGTPLENRLDEFRRLISFLQPRVAEEVVHATVAGTSGDDVVGLAAFRTAVAPAYLRRNQTDVLIELPERIEKEEWVELSPAGERAYREAVRAQNLMAMRRSVTLGAGNSAAKLVRLDEILAEHRETGRKVLVFSFFLDVLDAVEARFPTHGRIDGSTPALARTELVDAFSALEGHAVLVAQIQAAGVGLNLQAASVVVLMEPQWKPSIEEQAIARAHRMGQTDTVLVHRLLAADSVDERLRELVAEKAELFDAFARESAVAGARRDSETGDPDDDQGSLTARVLHAETRRIDGVGA